MIERKTMDKNRIRREYRERCSELRKSFAGNDKANYDFGFLLDIIYKKLRCMQTYFKSSDCMSADKSFVDSIDEALDCFDRYYADEYFDDAMEFESSHIARTYFDPDGVHPETRTTTSEEERDGETQETLDFIDAHNLRAFRTVWDDDSNERKWAQMMCDAEAAKHADIKKAFEIIGDNIESWWD